MRNDVSEIQKRQWAMLRAIPRAPHKITVTGLLAILRAGGFEASRRTIERDLRELACRYPLIVDESTKPQGWSWDKKATVEFMPRLTVSQSVAFSLAQVHIRDLLPRAMFNDLAPVFAAADRELESTGWKDWHKRTAVVPPTFALLPPTIDAQVLADVQQAAARRCTFTANYRGKGKSEPREHTIHPIALLFRGSIHYLVCTINDYTTPRQLAVQRMSDTRLGSARCRQPPGFNLDDYIATELSIESRGMHRLVLWFDPETAEHLRETPLSKDQTWKPVPGTHWIEVTGTREVEQRLRWWLLGFGKRVQVREPEVLRLEMIEELRGALAGYEE